MSQNIGTLVSSAIRPNDSLDPISTAYSNEIKGGAHGYQTFDEMLVIPIARRQWGMLVTVYDDFDTNNNATYQLRYGYSSTDLLDDVNWVKTSLDKNPTTEWIDSVIKIRVVEPTLEPFLGDRYLLGTSTNLFPAGVFWDNYTATIIAEYNSVGSWNLTYPTNGMTVRVDNDDNSIYKYEGNYPTGTWKQEKITQVFYIEPTSISGLTYSVSTDPIFNTYSRDLIFLTKFNRANIGTASLNINGLGYKNIKIATKNGVRDLIITDIVINSIYSLTYNGTYFQMTKPFPTDAYNIEYYIAPGEVVTVQANEQYWVYGDLTIAGTLVNYGKVIIANGSIILQGSGSLNNQGDGELILVDLFNTPTFNTTSTIQMSSTMTINGPSVSSTIISNSITTNLLNTVGGVTASYLLSNDGGGSFKWVAPTVGGSDTNSNLFYNSGGTVSATNSTTGIYRTGSLNIGSGTVYGNRFVVSSSGGTISLVVDETGNIYNYDSDVMANTKFGYTTLYFNTTGTNNTAFGNQTLKANITGNQNTAFGAQSLMSNTTGFENIAIGYQSLVSNLTGYQNIVIGYKSLQTATNSYYNLVIGYQSLYNNTSGSLNTTLGGMTMYNNTSGFANVAIGSAVLMNNTTGYQNVTVGTNASYYNTTGIFNVVLGSDAFSRNTTGSYNIAIGPFSGRTISGTGDINTGTGATNSNSSIFIGYDTRPSTGNNTNEIVIGYEATGSGSNSVTLGADTITKTQLRGQLKVSNVLEYTDNTTALSAGLVAGDVYRTGDLLKIVH